MIWYRLHFNKKGDFDVVELLIRKRIIRVWTIMGAPSTVKGGAAHVDQ